MKIKEEMGVGGGGIAGIGQKPNASMAANMTDADKARFAEPGVTPRKKKDPRIVKNPMTRSSLQSFKQWVKGNDH